MKYSFYIIALLFSFQVIAQESQKTYETKFTEIAPTIDGVLDDAAWKNAAIATNFVMLRPGSGTPEPKNLKSEVKIVYDNEAIYFAAFLHDDKPHEIPMEFQTRDNFGNADFFGVAINPQNDGINQTEFFVMSTGNQNDAKVTAGNEDFSWNAVWYSEVSLVDDGWIVEMKIPYSALRFSNESIQTWSMNFHRRHQKTRDHYSWNFIAKDKGSIAQYDGLLTGIKNIHPPVRLSFSPYASAIVDEFKGDYEFGWSAGMDLKYGITESFTLDATLIPDFGQTAYDEQILNISPFETKFSEKRQFFTEGLDLFSKADLFYTRRVGSSPSLKSWEIVLSENETIKEYPNKVDMINALKLSGRTKNGLGIGVFNAITKKTKATILKNIADETREIVVEPIANYNVLVLDQQFNKNSSVTLVNTNVLRQGYFRDANVTAALFDLKTKNSKYGMSGGIAMSTIFEDKTTSGYEGKYEIGKVSGNHQFDVGWEFRNKNYDKNDLGFQRKNNYMEFQSSYSYRIFEPKGNFNNFGIYFWNEINYLMSLDTSLLYYKEKPNLYTGSYAGISAWATTKKQLSFGGNLNLDIGKQFDYNYNYQITGKFYKTNPNIGLNGWISTDYSKVLAINSSFYLGTKVNDPQNYTAFSLSPRYRISNNMLMDFRSNFNYANNQKDFVKQINEIDVFGKIDEIDVFGKRDRLTITNTFSTKYNFNTKSSLGMSFRHYWSEVTYSDSFYKLENDGSLSNFNHSENEDINTNIWNFDLSYSLEFAPGSQLSFLYRNSIFTNGDNTDLSYFKNAQNLFDTPLSNQLSFKLIYYLDYNSIKI